MNNSSEMPDQCPYMPWHHRKYKVRNVQKCIARELFFILVIQKKTFLVVGFLMLCL